MAASTSSNDARFRLYALSGLFCLWLLAICLRLVYLQIFCYGDFERRALHQQQRSFDLSPKRGVIYDRAGRELAMSIQVDSAFVVPSEAPDLANAISLITRITKDDPRVVLADCRAHKTFCWVARKADAEVIERIRALNLQGIHFQKEPKRFYPKRELAAQVLGYVGTDDQGLSGLERQFNQQLQGKPGKLMISVDARKRWFASVEKEPEAGNSLVLTIDQNIQYIAERELERGMEETHAIAGTVIVENPRTGEILALTNRPTFNPNIRKEIRNEALKDRAVSDIYEPGSTFKMVTISAGLEEKITRPGRNVRLPDGIDRHQWHAHPRQQAAWHALGGRHYRGVERRRRHQSRAAAGRRAPLQIHSRFRIRPANRDRTSGRNARLDQAGGTLVESFDWRDLHGPGDRHFAAAARFADLDDCQRRGARSTAHRGRHDCAAE